MLTCERCKSIHVQAQGFVCPTSGTVVSHDSSIGFCEKCDSVTLLIERQCTKADVAKAKKLRLAAIKKWSKENLEEVEKIDGK